MQSISELILKNHRRRKTQPDHLYEVVKHEFSKSKHPPSPGRIGLKDRIFLISATWQKLTCCCFFFSRFILTDPHFWEKASIITRIKDKPQKFPPKKKKKKMNQSWFFREYLTISMYSVENMEPCKKDSSCGSTVTKHKQKLGHALL